MDNHELLDGAPSGLPTDHEIKLLNQRWHNLERGQQLDHNEIASVIETPYGSNRYRTVVERWKGMLRRDRNLILVGVPGVGYRALEEHERIGYVMKKQASSRKQIRHAYKILATTDENRLDDEHKVVLTTELAKVQKIAKFMLQQKKEAPALPSAI